MLKESDIMHENSGYWVLKDHKNRSYTVLKSGLTHSTADSSYELNDDGLSIAIARCNYLAKAKGE